MSRNENVPLDSKHISFQTTTFLGIVLAVISFGIIFYMKNSLNNGASYIFVLFILPILLFSSIYIFFKSLILFFEIETTNNELILFGIYVILIFIHILSILPAI